MIHKPIILNNLTLSLPHKTCFEDFNIQIGYGQHIAIIGRNGSGKSTLLKILLSLTEPTDGNIIVPADVIFGYVPQIVEEFNSLSGGQRFNAALTKALSLTPNLLLLDEPTNHLDKNNRKALMRMLRQYPGTLIMVSHDVELLRNCTDTLWHIDNGKITVFTGKYDDYIREVVSNRATIEQELSRLDKQKKDMHQVLMKEQKRAAKSKAKGEKSIHQKKWPTIVSAAKAGRAEETSGRKKSAIDHKKQDLTERLSNLRLPEIINTKFSLSSADIGERTLVNITEGSVCYQGHSPIIGNINLSIRSNERIAIAGDNGSGKSTLIKAILDEQAVIKSGDWHVPSIKIIGYLDQQYNTISPENTVLETIANLTPSWTHNEIRRHLNDFLFRKNEEVNITAGLISGGEKARLSLAQIAAKTPRLLILDEITNNLDLETRNHIIQILKNYPGAMIVISHDSDFLSAIGITAVYKIENGYLIS